MSSVRAGAPPPPKVITKLAEDVVNRIAAGEVMAELVVPQIIQRPANALKELIENALDAGSTSIRITVKDGGIKLLQIQDNGSGIRKADLPILCERFTTSKLKAFDDLSRLGTYGFRGEALASISHVAHISVTTKTRDDACAWKASYSDGVMIPVKAGATSNEPVPCAGNDGTLIVVEDLFYNVPMRLKALRSSSDEYLHIVAVVLQYSIHNAGVAMVCKKASSANPEVNTPVGATVLDNIGLHYGEHVKRELVELDLKDEELGIKATGWLSGPNYGVKKGTFLFFINHRLVKCSSLKQALEAFYAALLAKGSHPFVYLSLEISPSKVDVNVHPTKSEVGFEDEDEVVKVICDALANKFAASNESRSFQIQTLLPGASRPSDVPSTSTRDQGGSNNTGPSSTSTSIRKVAPKSMIRTDHKTRTLDSMFEPVSSPLHDQDRGKGKGRLMEVDDDGDQVIDPGREDENEDQPSVLSKRKRTLGAEEDENEDDDDIVIEEEPRSISSIRPELQKATSVKIPQSQTTLRSIRELRQEVLDRADKDLDAIVKGHIFVGVADLRSHLSLIQHRTKLYSVNHAALSEELFYQLALRQFGQLARIDLQPPVPLRDTIKLAVESDEGREAAQMPTEEIVERLYDTIHQGRAMLEEYFALSISVEGMIESLPLIIPSFLPNLVKLPLCESSCSEPVKDPSTDLVLLFLSDKVLLRIGVVVDWEDEKPCFESFLRELAFFYIPGPSAPEFDDNVAASETDPSTSDEHRPAPSGRTEAQEKEEKRALQHIVWPVAKQYLVAPHHLKKRDVVQLTSMENLFKVREVLILVALMMQSSKKCE
ncbi:BZ3500_MvSof-1268-A1-R1_Chr4-2g06975 [Microbotryum saponariae]|uniref:BZ3500_MvSof-1268-A1-R1_Chr4-2g06975 protein n=1 Tax=Microbotryum saponariae TaxID=289078 RepID=A0A2X0KYP1_9BASI|nr:BZ3500_MvSof-1268-A1-R1_Chr4-2g06975 [Microbotryum saponariae]SDA06640.1 BZ3501_MvSof-1269-A2-R1_Chr4-2g06686 [Microbotryum saponariae]